jgi:hypothetical protein
MDPANLEGILIAELVQFSLDTLAIYEQPEKGTKEQRLLAQTIDETVARIMEAMTE